MCDNTEKRLIILLICIAVAVTALYAGKPYFSTEMNGGAEILTIGDASFITVPGNIICHAGLVSGNYRFHATGGLGCAVEALSFHRFARLGFHTSWLAGAGFAYDSGNERFSFTLEADIGLRGMEFSHEKASERVVSLYASVAPGILMGESRGYGKLLRQGRIMFPIAVTYGGTSFSVSAGMGISILFTSVGRSNEEPQV